MDKSVQRSAKEYFRAVTHAWWALIMLVSGLIGMAIDISRGGLDVPLWVWIGFAIITITVAQFIAFHKLRLEREGLTELVTPKLTLEFKHGDRSFRESEYFKIPDLDRWEGYIEGNYERYSIRITNSGMQSISNMKAEIIAIEPRPKGSAQLPFRLQVRNEADHYNPGESMYAYIAEFNTSEPDRITLCHNSSADREIPASRYSLTVMASGKDVPPVTKKFSISAIGNRLYMCNEPQINITYPPEMSAQSPTHTLTE